MKVHTFDGHRVELAAKKSFAEVVAAFEQRVPVQDLPTITRLVDSRASRRQIEDAVQGMVGTLGFMVLAKLDVGPLVSLLGKPKKLTVYLLGNPLLANRMFEHDPAVGVYAPLRVAIYEDYEGTTRITYDVPSSLLTQFGNAEIRAVANLLDDRMKSLAESLAT